MRSFLRPLLIAACLPWLPACGDASPAPTPDVLTPEPEPQPEPARPTVTAASIAEGARDVYPVELYDDQAATPPGIYLRKRLSVTFSAAMNPALARVTLQERTPAGPSSRELTGQWSTDGRTLHVTVTAPADGGPPLEGETAYALDLTALRGAEGNTPLDAQTFLGDGALDFTTAARDGALEHACAHTIANTPELVQSTSEPPPGGFPPATDTGHARYRVTLPTESPRGYTELVSRPSGDEEIRLYLDRSVTVGVLEEETGTDVPVETSAVTPVCAGITHVARFSIRGGDRFYYPRFTTTPGATFEFILEREVKK